MLTALRQNDQVKVLARDSTNLDAPFVCPKCTRLLILRKGQIKVHHFAHKPPVTCSFGAGETEQHHKAKLEIFDALKLESNVADLEVEKDFGASVADVFARISGIPVAIEIQRSTLSVNDIARRTANYHRLGIAVLWIGLPTDLPSSRKYSPKAWEKWCHAAYFGRLYFWSYGQVVQPVHLAPYQIHVESTTWHEDGLEKSGGGYDRRSKRWRTPVPGVPMLLSRHFASRMRTAWTGGTVTISNCQLFIDKQEKWWTNEA